MASYSKSVEPGVAALLLAAGESTRMGQLKALLPWRGSTLLEHQLSSLAEAGVSRTVVVLGHEISRLEPTVRDRPGISWVQNPDYRQGKTTSIKAGIKALLGSGSALLEAGLLLLNVDQPRSADTVRCIMDLHMGQKDAKRPRLITLPTYEGRGGHPIIMSTKLLSELENINEESLGIKAVVLRHEADLQRVEMDTPEILLDLNTPLDYELALANLNPG